MQQVDDENVDLPAVQAAGEDNSNLIIYSLAFLLTTLGIVYVQEAERKIPMNYANRYKAGALARQSYLPFKVRTWALLYCTPPVLSTMTLHLPNFPSASISKPAHGGTLL